MYQRLLVFEQNKTKKELAQKVLVNDLFFKLDRGFTPPPAGGKRGTITCIVHVFFSYISYG